jgi:putative endonuclease
MHTRQKGRKGEELAKDYLLRNNYQIIKQNYYAHWGEIDIIAWDSGAEELVFVEVKARTSRRYGYPEDALDERKLTRMIMTAEDYLSKVGYNGSYRFDCLALEMEHAQSRFRLKHFKNIGD